MLGVVLVTGASSGFGRATAARLARRGYRVFGTSRQASPPVDPRDGTDPARANLVASSSGTIEMLPLDVDDDESVEGCVARVVAVAGRIDAVVNNAGISLFGAVEDTTIAEARQQLETNFFGAARVCRAVLPTLRAQRSGTIVNVGSLGGRMGLPYQAFYSASKFALAGFTESLRVEMRSSGVRVVLIEPGDAATGMTARRQLTARALAGSARAASCRRALEVQESEERRGLSAESVAATIERAILSPRPRARYVVAPASQALLALLRPLVPDWLYDSAIARHYRVG